MTEVVGNNNCVYSILKQNDICNSDMNIVNRDKYKSILLL